MAIDGGKWARRAYVGVATASVIILATNLVSHAQRMDALSLELHALTIRVESLDLSDPVDEGTARKLISLMRRFDAAIREAK